MSSSVQQIIELIDRLPDDERAALELHLADRAETAWQREADEAREFASRRGLDESGIDDAVRRHRYGE